MTPRNTLKTVNPFSIKHLLAAALCCSSVAQAESFAGYKQGNFRTLLSAQGSFTGDGAIYKKSADDNVGSLRILGGENKSVVLTLAKTIKTDNLISLSFQAERWTAKKPFSFIVEGKSNGSWEKIYNGNKLKVGAFSPTITIKLQGTSYSAFRFKATTAKNSGVLIDNIVIAENKPMMVASATVNRKQIPLLIRKEAATVLSLSLNAEGSINPKSLKSISFDTTGTNQENVASYQLFQHGKVIAETAATNLVEFKLETPLEHGANEFSLGVKLKPTASLADKVLAKANSYQLNEGDKKEINGVIFSQRIGYNMAHSGDMVKRTNGKMQSCKRFRIPGMVTTNKGTILAVYDLRWGQNGDLPGDIDVGMSRSTDGGKTWEAPRPIMDMGTYLGESEDKNGVGDPAILVDKKTGDIYVVALLAHGLNKGWYWGLSKPGMDPKLTGQCIMIKSTDDGKTWSQPKNITKDIKDPAWQLMLDGPGAGITTRDGALVFAFQFKNPVKGKKGKYSACSALLYSKDQGKTWKVSKGVDYPQETTEAQVVELNDGTLMLNCRISAGGRAVFTTKDFGETWVKHPTSGRGTFNMSGCMSSIIRHSSVKDGDAQNILLFSGPADGGKKRRSHMSIRYSLDEGETWSKPYLLDQIGGAYSCMSLVENNGKKDIAIVYEGSQANMTFELISLEELMGAGK